MSKETAQGFVDKLNEKLVQEDYKIRPPFTYDSDRDEIRVENYLTTESDPDLQPIFDTLGLDASKYRLKGDLKFSIWEQSVKGTDETRWLKSFRGLIVPKASYELSYEDFRDALNKGYRDLAQPILFDPLLTAIHAVGDFQVGKRDVYGATPELLNNVNGLKRELEKALEHSHAETLGHLNPGDMIEGMHNYAGQRHLNDALPNEQILIAQEIIYDLLGFERQFCANHLVSTVSSNHAAERDGKDYLGRPVDDYGIGIYRSVELGYKASGHDSSFFFQEPWKEYVIVPFGHFSVAMTHGHRAKNKNAMMQWWKNQMFLHPDDFENVTVFLNGHWHHAFMQVVGRGRYLMQTPSMDVGSSQYSGGDSFPGSLVIMVDESGRIHDFRVLEVRSS